MIAVNTVRTVRADRVPCRAFHPNSANNTAKATAPPNNVHSSVVTPGRICSSLRFSAVFRSINVSATRSCCVNVQPNASTRTSPARTYRMNDTVTGVGGFTFSPRCPEEVGSGGNPLARRSSSDSRGSGCSPDSPGSVTPPTLIQPSRRFSGPIRQDQVGTGPADRGEHLQDRAFTVDPAVGGGTFDHRVLAGDVVGRHRYR